MRFLRRRKKFVFLVKKKCVFFLGHHSTLFLNLFWLKTTKEKNPFLDQKHGLTPLEKCDFWDVEQLCFSSQKKFVFYPGHHSTLFLVLFDWKQLMKKKNPFFDQKHGLTPLEKCNFWDVEKFCFSSQKKFVFYLGHHSTLFLVLFWLKTNKEKKFHFLTKSRG